MFCVRGGGWGDKLQCARAHTHARVARACVCVCARLHASNNVVLSKGAVPLAHWRVCSLSWFIAGQGRHWSIEACVCGFACAARVSTAAHDQYLLYHNGGCLRPAARPLYVIQLADPTHTHTQPADTHIRDCLDPLFVR